MLLIGLLRQSSVPVQLKLRKLGHDGMHGRDSLTMNDPAKKKCILTYAYFNIRLIGGLARA